MTEKLKIGLIGVGRIGKMHASNLASHVRGAELAAIADVNENAARAVAAQYDVPVAVSDYHALLDDPALNAVVICTNTDTHARIVSEAAARGKHVFCEKPLGVGLDEIDHALTEVERAGVNLQVGFNRRFDTNFARVRRAVETGEIGMPHLLHIISRDPIPRSPNYFLSSSGIFLDTTIHDFDMARFLIGSEVREVYVVAGRWLPPSLMPPGELDTALILLHFENGTFGTIDNSRHATYGYDQRVEVFGSQGAIRTDNNYPNNALLSTGENVRRDLPLYFFLERYAESFVTEMQAFVDSTENRTTPPVTGKDGRASVVLAFAAQRSLDEHRPVALNEIG